MGKPAKAKNKEKKDKEKKDKEKSTKAGARKGQVKSILTVTQRGHAVCFRREWVITAQISQDGPTSASSWTPKTLDQQLRLMGLRVVDVVGDGNCFFRAVVRLPALSVIIELNCGIKYPEIRLTADNRVLAFVAALQGNPPLGALPSSTALIADAGRLPRFALLIASQGDQLYGKGARHKEVRETVCAHMEERREFYECFVEDDEGFDKYVRRMRRDGQWAGHMEVQATSEALGVNITIHQLGQPPWVVKNLDVGARMIHLSYHEGEHYNRRAEPCFPCRGGAGCAVVTHTCVRSLAWPCT